MDHTALFTVQGGVGLDHPNPSHVHSHFHALRGRFPAERARPQQPKEQEVRRRPHRRHRPHRYVIIKIAISKW